MTYNGILLVDKPQDITSHDLVHQIRKKLKIKNVGHAGTLDPLASGLMLILLGKATKISDLLMSHDKSYECEIELGKTTDTLDISGTVLNEMPVKANIDEVLEAVKSLKGSFQWEIPSYSAKKVGGKKLYELARDNKSPKELPKKEMTFYKAELLSYESPFLKVRLSCSKGSFIRTWAHELGKYLGCGACISALRRLESNRFHIEKALSLIDVEEENLKAPYFISMEKALEDLPSLEVKDFDAHLVRHGQISQTLHSRLHLVDHYCGQPEGLQFKVMDPNSNLLALVHRAKGGRYRFTRVFPA